MRAHLDRDLDNLKKEILEMGTLVEEATAGAINALLNRDAELGEKVMEGDTEIDQKEISIEEECLKILALHQPVAGDLRYIVSILKVNNDLERMGDIACHIADRATALARLDPIGTPEHFEKMVGLVQRMVRDSLDALVKCDADLALKTIRTDDIVDEIHWEAYKELRARMRSEKGIIDRAFYTISTCRHLERIGDLATNIAEDVYFMVTGEIIRHMDESGLGHGDN